MAWGLLIEAESYGWGLPPGFPWEPEVWSCITTGLTTDLGFRV